MVTAFLFVNESPLNLIFGLILPHPTNVVLYKFPREWLLKFQKLPLFTNYAKFYYLPASLSENFHITTFEGISYLGIISNLKGFY